MKKINLKYLFDKDKKYCGKVEVADQGDVLLVFEEDVFSEAKKNMDSKSKEIDQKKLATFNRYMFAGVFQINIHKGKIKWPEVAKNRMRIPWKCNEVIIDEEIDILAAKVFSNSICITEFVPRNRLIKLIRRLQYGESGKN